MGGKPTQLGFPQPPPNGSEAPNAAGMMPWAKAQTKAPPPQSPPPPSTPIAGIGGGPSPTPPWRSGGNDAGTAPSSGGVPVFNMPSGMPNMPAGGVPQFSMPGGAPPNVQPGFLSNTMPTSGMQQFQQTAP